MLTSGPEVARPNVSGPGAVRSRSAVGSSIGGSVPNSPNVGPIQIEVSRVQSDGNGRVGKVRDALGQSTKDARGASADAADEVKKW